MECYAERYMHPPFSLWAGTNAHSTLAFRSLRKGSFIPTAGDTHSWYAPPSAGKMLRLGLGAGAELDTYQVVQLFNFLKAHEEAIRTQAKATADVLIPESHKRTEAALKADAGFVDYSE